jgi:cation transport regulator ChaC
MVDTYDRMSREGFFMTDNDQQNTGPTSYTEQFNHLNTRESQVKRLNAAIDNMPGLRESLEESGIDLTQDDIDVNIFGYGSLPSKPHYTHENLTVTDALLPGMKRDFFCPCSRSGTNTNPGLVYGLEAVEGETQAGGVLAYEDLTIAEKADLLEIFMDREGMLVQGEKIYRFEVFNVEMENGEMRSCITCVANPETPGYAGDLTLEERAAIIAKAENTEFDTSSNAIPDNIATLSAAPDCEMYNVSSNDIRTSRSYFDRFGVLPLQAERLALSRQSEPTNDNTETGDFRRRYEQAIERDTERTMELNDAIQAERVGMSPEEQLLRYKIELHQAENHMGNFRKNAATTKPELIEVTEGYIEGLQTQIADLESQMSGAAPAKPNNEPPMAGFSHG